MTEPQASLKMDTKNGWTWVSLPGVMDLHAHQRIEDAIVPLLGGSGARVVLDMADVKHLYSAGITLLVRLQRMARDHQSQLCLVNVGRRLRDILHAANLNKVFMIYATDVEFEVSRDDVWKEKMLDETPKFLCVTQIEHGICRVSLSGHMTALNDLSSFRSAMGSRGAVNYIFDFSNLDSIDSYGLHVLQDTLLAIRSFKKNPVCFGAGETVRSLMEHLSITSMITVCADEQEALATAGRMDAV